MSIRIRTRDGIPTVAVCAARSMPKEGDIYLDDAAHHVLYVKFSLDFDSEGHLVSSHRGSDEELAIEAEESNNPNRLEWDATFGNPDALTPQSDVAEPETSTNV